MKRILSILILLFVINACDDGDLKVDTIDFSEISAQKCDVKDVIYKIKDSEILFIEIPAATFVNDETPAGTPIEVPISSTVKVTYRQYDGTVSSANICPTVPDATPNLSEEWKATAGSLLITSTAIKTTDATTNGTKITGYKHYIVFKDIVFLKPDGTTQTYVGTSFIFGNYTTTVSQLAFGFDTEVAKSTCDNRIFNFNGSEALILNVADYATLFENTVTTTPRTALIGSANKLTYRLYSGPVNDAFFCTIPTPTTATLSQEWTALDGVDGVSGIIEVSTTTLGTDFQHTIRLKKVTFKKGNSTFYLGDDILYGSFITTP